MLQVFASEYHGKPGDMDKLQSTDSGYHVEEPTGRVLESQGIRDALLF